LFPIALVGLAALIHAGCSRTQAVQSHDPKGSETLTVAVAKAAITDLSRGLVLTAEFRPYQEVDVMAKVAGYVKEIYVDVGDRVKQGQVLAVLEIPEMADDLRRAQAAVDRANSEVARAEDELRRSQSAHEISHLSFTRLDKVAKQRPGLVAQQEIDDAHGKDLVSEAQISGAKSSLAASRQEVDVHKAELSKIRTMIEYTRVTAPFAGVITKRYADTGSMIQAGTASQTQAMPVVKLSQNTLLRLILPVPESAVPAVRIGQQVEVKVPSLKRSFPGRVARFSDKVQLSTRTMDTEVDVQNPSLVLVPGMYAEVNLQLAEKANVLAVPVTAVDAESGSVMVVTSEHKIELRKVKLGMETADRVEVQSGLQDGELVVVGNRGGLQPGQTVQPKIVSMSEAS
jgi:RND family efflux transporter MFP subunit